MCWRGRSRQEVPLLRLQGQNLDFLGYTAYKLAGCLDVLLEPDSDEPLATVVSNMLGPVIAVPAVAAAAVSAHPLAAWSSTDPPD